MPVGFAHIVLVTAVMFLLVWEFAAPEATCHFPKFLQGSPVDGGKKTWTSRMWWLHIRKEPKWAEKQDIYVKNGSIWRHRDEQTSCERSPRGTYKSSFGLCTERRLVYNRTCISQEGFNTYRVIQYKDGTHRFTCMKFVKRSESVVQVYEGPLSHTNDPELCKSDGFRLDEWPWVAPWNKVSSFCHISGGFSFRTIRRLTNEDFCENEWRRSSLEIECLRGDGMTFMAPKGSKCNPFLLDGDDKKLTCWAGWENEDYVFMIASDVGRQPSYCLRFPRIRKGEFSVLVYFSVICPTEPDGQPPLGIEYYELRMYKKDPSSCRDEDEGKCLELITSSETCTKDHMLAPHCAKSCGKCHARTAIDIKTRRCAFDPIMFGDWVLYDQTGAHDVTINKDEVKIKDFATFHCLSPANIENKNVYKTSSSFDNGCAPRYTCLEVDRKNNNVLQYRIGPSHREERKMEDLCIFRDDPPPFKDTFRSYYFKNLILAKKLWPSFCGLDGVIPFNGTIHGRHCQGVISDWDKTTCMTRGTLVLHSDTCKQLILPMEFQCLGFIHNDEIPLRQLLLTRSMDGRHSFNCWVLTKYFDQAEWPKRVMYQLPNTQCSLLMEIETSVYSSSQIFIHLEDKQPTECAPERYNHIEVTHMEMSKSTESPYAIQNHHVTDEKPKTDSSRFESSQTDTPFQNVRSKASGECCRKYIDCVFLFVLILFCNHVC